MLNPFPDLLVLGFFAPTLVRVAVAVLFLYAAYVHWHAREEIADTRFPFVGKGEWIPWFSILAHLVIGAMFFFGYYTQIAALVGVFTSIKGLIYAKRFKVVYFYPRSTYALLLAMCLSLLLSGAGAFAFDIPL